MKRRKSDGDGGEILGKESDGSASRDEGVWRGHRHGYSLATAIGSLELCVDA